jgi:etoposide-induced 2.4 mRNA
MASYGSVRPQTYHQYDPAHRGSSRQLYPTFLSLGDSLQLQARWAWQGLYDAFRWNVVFRTMRT